MIAKEARALAPAWAAVAATLVACAFIRALYFLAVPAYFIGAATLGAMSLGHEYSYRTVPLLLTLPISRYRVLLIKLGVLGAFLLLLTLVAAAVVPLTRGAMAFRGTVLWLPFIASLFVTPYLTIVSRSPVGGAVFTLSLAGVLLTAGEWIGVKQYGYTRDVDAFRVAFVWYGLALLSAASAAALWWTFGRLQALEGGGTVVDLAPEPASVSQSLRRRSPTWLLIKKELRLQQLAFAVAAVFVAASVVLSMPQRSTAPSLWFLAVPYAGLLTLLIGSTASAEERHLRTLDAQLLLPVPAARQWGVKIGVVLMLTIALAILLPAGLENALLGPRNPSFVTQVLFVPHIILALLAWSALSVYVSTLCSSAVWALVVSAPSAVAAAAFVIRITGWLQSFFYSLEGRPDWHLVQRTSVIVTLAVIGVVLGLAFVNHRTADRSPRRTAAHAAIAAAATVAAAVVVAVVGALSR